MNRPRFYLALLVVACAAGYARADRIIITVAGGGPDHVAALSAAVFAYDLVVEPSGSVLLLSDPGVQRVDPSGWLNLVAGAGNSSYSGDGGPALEAQFNFAPAMAIDPQGRILLVENHGNRVRRIETDGTVTTVAGTGVETGSVDGAATGDPSDDLGDGLPAAQATLRQPRGIAVTQAGDILIGDTGNNRIRVVDAGTGIITTRIGPAEGIGGDGGPAGSASLFDVGPLALDADGNLYFIDGHRVRRVDHATSVITTVAGQATNCCDAEHVGDGGPATSALLAQPSDLAVRGQMLAIADTNHSRVRMVDLSTGLIRTIAGNGLAPGYLDGPGGDPADDFRSEIPATQALLGTPSSVAFLASGDLLIGSDSRVVRVDAATETLHEWAGTGDWPSGDGGQATRAWLGWPHGLVLQNDRLYIASQGINNGASVRAVEAATGRITTVAGCVDPVDCSRSDGVSPTRRDLVEVSVAPAPEGDVLVLDTRQNMVFRLDPEGGTMARVAGNGFGYHTTGDGVPATETGVPAPKAGAYGPDGQLYILEGDPYFSGNCLRRVDPATGLIWSLVGTACPGDWFSTYLQEMSGVVDLAFDPAGRLHLMTNNRIFILDLDTWAITPVVGDGVYEDSGDGGPAVSARLAYASRFGFDAAGQLVIQDVDANRIRRIDSGGIIDTIIGSGAWGFSGDGGPALAAKLSLSDFGSGLALPPNGDVFLADGHSGRVRVVTESTLPVAQGGPDRSMQCEGPQGATVTLDASGSSGTGPLSFLWEGPFGEVMGVAPEVSLPLGASAVSLVARQGFLASHPDDAAFLVFVQPEGLSDPLDGLVLESDAFTGAAPIYRRGARIHLDLALDCRQGRLESLPTMAPVLAAVRLDGADTSLVAPGGLAFQAGAGGTWEIELRTHAWETGSYEVVIRMPDGRRFKAAFELRTGRLRQR